MTSGHSWDQVWQAGLMALVVVLLSVCVAIGLFYLGLMPDAPQINNTWLSAGKVVLSSVALLVWLCASLCVVVIVHVLLKPRKTGEPTRSVYVLGALNFPLAGVIVAWNATTQPMPDVMLFAFVGICLLSSCPLIASLLLFGWRESSVITKTALYIAASILVTESMLILTSEPVDPHLGLNNGEVAQEEVEQEE